MHLLIITKNTDSAHEKNINPINYEGVYELLVSPLKHFWVKLSSWDDETKDYRKSTSEWF